MKLIQKTKGKLNNTHAFSLAETLVAIIIMLMVASIVTAGIPAAKDAYERIVIVSNAEVLLSTTISEMRNEIGEAKDVEADNTSGTNTVVTYYNDNTKSKSKIYIDEYKFSPEKIVNTVLYQRYTVDDDLMLADPSAYTESDPVRIVSAEAATDDLYVTYDSVGRSGNVVTFSGLKVMKPGKTKSLTKSRDVEIRLLSY